MADLDPRIAELDAAAVQGNAGHVEHAGIEFLEAWRTWLREAAVRGLKEDEWTRGTNPEAGQGKDNAGDGNDAASQAGCSPTSPSGPTQWTDAQVVTGHGVIGDELEHGFQVKFELVKEWVVADHARCLESALHACAEALRASAPYVQPSLHARSWEAIDWIEKRTAALGLYDQLRKECE